ncbi:PucR family transcriptional regulator [Leucobacter chinensis]|uniref:PucR family transcriptional regulator n=1 Tax=Leucobacter chinensis TaxID=2851010 RepID=UPI001C24D0F8|nr:PucR family transcriptional regulator [Leucobacter chinensis]
MIRLHDIIEIPDLGLSTVHAPAGPSPEVRWAHVSELVDPSPWLLGNEFLLTTGFALEDEAAAWDLYCSRLKSAGVSVVGMSTGPSLPYPSIPEGLRNATRSHGLALVHVPHETLMQSVVRKVSDALHEAANQDLLRSYSVQRQLSEAASSSNGTTRIVGVLSRTLGLKVVVLDDRLRTLAKCSEEAEASIEPIRGELKTRLKEGLRWSISEAGQGDSLVVLPLGTEGRLSGVLTCSKEGDLSVHDRAALSLAASLLGILLERRQAAQLHRRAVESQLLGAVIADHRKVDDLARHLTGHGISVEHLEVLSTSTPNDTYDVEQFVTLVLEHCDEVIFTSNGGVSTFVILNAHEPLRDVLTHGVIEHRLAPAGLGERRPFTGLTESLTEAQFARSVAQSRDMPLIERHATGGYRALMMMGTPEARRLFAESVLAPLDRADAHKRSDLFKTVRAYVSTLGNHELTAEALGVHRHTVRSRLAKIAEVTGRDLSHPEDFLELWMAVEFRANAGKQPSTTEHSH